MADLPADHPAVALPQAVLASNAALLAPASQVKPAVKAGTASKQQKPQPLTAEQLYQEFLKKGSAIKLVNGSVTTVKKNSVLVADKFNVNGLMSKKQALDFINRFVTPLLKHKTGKKLFNDVQHGRRRKGVFVMWATGGQTYGITGTIPRVGKDARNAKVGSDSVIFIDENGPDWKAVKDLKSMPDIGFLHELYHAKINMLGKNDGGTEREARILENQYRNERGASFLRKLP